MAAMQPDMYHLAGVTAAASPAPAPAPTPMPMDKVTESAVYSIMNPPPPPPPSAPPSAVVITPQAKEIAASLTPQTAPPVLTKTTGQPAPAPAPAPTAASTATSSSSSSSISSQSSGAGTGPTGSGSATKVEPQPAPAKPQAVYQSYSEQTAATLGGMDSRIREKYMNNPNAEQPVAGTSAKIIDDSDDFYTTRYSDVITSRDGDAGNVDALLKASSRADQTKIVVEGDDFPSNWKNTVLIVAAVILALAIIAFAVLGATDTLGFGALHDTGFMGDIELGYIVSGGIAYGATGLAVLGGLGYGAYRLGKWALSDDEAP